MGYQGQAQFERITLRRARVLRELADGWNERQTSERLRMTYAGVRSTVRDLKGICDCANVAELSRWWRANRETWAQCLAEAGGLESTAM